MCLLINNVVMKRARLTITTNNNYDGILVLSKQELLGNASKTTPTFRSYTNPQGSDISVLNDNITILSRTKCNIEKENLVFVLSENRTGVFIRLTNFSIKNLSGVGAEVTFETTGRYNYQEQFTISFNVYSEFLDLELSNSNIVYQDQRLQPNKTIVSFDVKCVKKTLGLLDWQYKPCNYTLSISEPFYFIDGGRKTNSKRLSSKLGFNTTLNIGLAELCESIIGQDLTPCIKKEGNGYSENSPLSTFRLEYSSIEIKNVQGINRTPIIGETEPIESFDAMFKSVTPHLEPWQNIDNDVEIKINPPFCFQETECDSLKIIAGPSLHQCIHVCLSSETDISYIGKKLIPIVSISAKGIKEEVKLQHPVIIQPKPKPEIEVKFVPELSPFRITDITKDIRMGYLEITNTCNNPLGEDLIIKRIEPSNKCISIEEAVYSPINPGKSAKVTVLKYKSQAFQDLTEEPFSVNCMIIVSSNAGVKNRKLELVVTEGTPVGNQDEIIIPITPLPQLNIGVSDQILCYDGEEKKDVDLNVSHWHDKPRKNVSLFLEDKNGVASLEENCFPKIAPNVDNKSQLLIDVSKLAINKPTQVVVSAKADYTYKVSKSVTIIKKAKEPAKPKIENYYSENNFIYANGQEYKVSTFEIINDTQSASEIEAESAEITSLCIEIAEQEKIVYLSFFRIDRPKDLLKPQERVKCAVLLKIEREKFDKDSDYFSYRPVCDGLTNYEEARNQTQYVTINRQLPVDKGKITFEPEKIVYNPNAEIVFVGKLRLQKSDNPNPDMYYDRINERIKLTDDDFYFEDENSNVLKGEQSFEREEKCLFLYWKVIGNWNNELQKIKLPICYYCDNVPEDNE